MTDTKPYFDRDDVQFPRLLDEVYGIITEDQKKELSVSMDLTVEDVDDIFLRASETFDAIKQQLDFVDTSCVFCGKESKSSVHLESLGINPQTEVFTMRDLTKLLGRNKDYIYRLHRAGKIPGRIDLPGIRYSKHQVMLWLLRSELQIRQDNEPTGDAE